MIEHVTLPKPPKVTDKNDPKLREWAEECKRILDEARKRGADTEKT